MTYRTGTFAKQPNGHWAYVPKPLPPSVPSLSFGSHLQALLSRADDALNRLNGSLSILPHPDTLVRMLARYEAVLSCRIEGITSTLQELLVAEAGVLGQGRKSDVQEVLDCVQAMEEGFSRMKELPVSARLIKEVHSVLLQGFRGKRCAPGEYRKISVWIGPAGASMAEATFVPPPADKIEQCMGELESYINAKDKLPPLMKIGLVHAQFETIHPFLDGNGRVGRLLISLMLSNDNIMHKPALMLSGYYMRHRMQYYQALQDTRTEEGWEKWLEFFLLGIAEASVQAAETVRRIVLLRDQDSMTIMKDFGRTANDAYLILDHLFVKPIVSVREAQKLTKKSFPATSNVLQRFVDCGMLSEVTGRKRHRHFIYNRYLQQFQDFTSASL